MKRSFIRICALAAAAVMCASSLSSCGFVTINKGPFAHTAVDSSTVAESAETTAPTETHTMRDPYVPPDKYEYTGRERTKAALDGIDCKMDGASVFIYTSDDRVASSLDPEDEGDFMSSAEAERKSMVEDTLDCTLFFTCERPEIIASKLDAAVLMDEYYADLLIVPPRLMSFMAARGTLYNLESLPFFSQDAVWYMDGTSELGAGYALYGVYSIATRILDDIECVIASGDAKKIEALEKDALDGAWTWDKMLSSSAAVDADASYRYGDVGFVDYTLVTEEETELAEPAADIDIDTETSETETETSVETEPETAAPEDIPLDDTERADALTSLVAASSELHFVEHKRGDVPTVYLPESIYGVADIANRLADAVNGTPSTSALKFHIGTLGEISSYAALGEEWTVLPLPKLSPEQENYASRTRSECVMCVPANTTDPDGASALLDALGASSLFFEDEYIDYHMHNTVKRESTLPLISLICESPSLDFARVFVDEDLTRATYGILFELVSDAEFDAEEAFSKREDAANKYLSKRFGTE